MADHNQKIAAQLQSVSKAFLMMDDDELIPLLLDTCSALLDEAEKRRPAVADMNRMERTEYTIGYKQLSKLVGHYAQELLDAEPLSDPTADPVDSMAQLEQMRAAVAAQNARNQELENKLNQAREELRSLCDFHRAVTDMGKTCTPKIIEAQKEENRMLLREVSRRQDTLSDLNSKKQQHSEVLHKINEAIQRVETEIEQIPAVHKELVAEHDAKCAELKRLQHAQELCSEEKQAELEKQILELKPTVAKLEQQMGTLSSQLQNFQNSRTELDRENQILRTDLLDCIDKAMSNLGLAMEEHQQALADIRCQADTYRRSLAECENIRSGLIQWFGSDRRQFDAVLAAIDRQEYTNLQQTLNVSAQNQVQDAFYQARTALEQVDRFLAQCAQAAQKDKTIVKRKAAAQ